MEKEWVIFWEDGTKSYAKGTGGLDAFRKAGYTEEQFSNVYGFLNRSVEDMYTFKNGTWSFNNCDCGNPEYGFDCVCEHVRKFPGEIEYSCEFCGLYKSDRPRCNKCEKDDE